MSGVDDFSTIEQLNHWAAQHGLINDDMVNLRRLQIMADAVSNQRERTDYVCDICSRRFNENSNLQRHKRSVHSDNEQYQCSVCFARFNRPDSLQRHLKLHTRKRKHDDEEINSLPAKKRTTENIAVRELAATIDETKAKCNWCGHQKTLLPNKKFCNSCSQQGWENSCSFGLRYVSWYKYLIVSLVFSHLGFWSGNLFLIAPFPDLCLLVPFYGFSL